MIHRPDNHVTRALRSRLEPTPLRENLPIIPVEALRLLEDLLPPRCKAPGEDPEEHLHYGGKVALVQALRQRYEDAKSEGPSGIDYDDEPYGSDEASLVDLEGAEKASP